MFVLLECPSQEHTVRLESNGFWRKTICPKCNVPVDPTRLRRIVKRLLRLFSKTPTSVPIVKEVRFASKGIPIPDEFRFARIKRQIDRLARDAWKSEEFLNIKFFLEPSELPASSPDKTIEAILGHVRQIAPGLSVPFRVPRVETGSLIDAGGQFKTSDGWVSVKLANHLLTDRKAVRAILAHEACHYILTNSGIKEDDYAQNERLTDLSMFVCGLGKLFLEGYMRESAKGEYRAGHRLGYLTDSEYAFAARYVMELRSNNSLKLPSRVEEVKLKLASRVDLQTRERLIKHAMAKHPQKSELEIYELVIEQFVRERR